MPLNDLTRYTAVRAQMQPGDVIALAGTKAISRVIEALSGDTSHVLMVHTKMEEGTFRVLVTQSTIEGGRSGAQPAYLSDVLANYPGRGWLCPLEERIRAQADWGKFNDFVTDAEARVTYDKIGLVGFLLRDIPILGPRICQSENAKQMFCSGYDVAAFEAAGILRAINYSQVTPAQFLAMHLYAPGPPVQLIGEEGTIARYNSVL